MTSRGPADRSGDPVGGSVADATQAGENAPRMSTEPPPDAAPAATPPKAGLRAKLKGFFDEYGVLGIVVFGVVSALTLAGTVAAAAWAVPADSAAVKAGAFAVGYLGYRATLPLRVACSFALTPLVARVVRRRKKADPGGA